MTERLATPKGELSLRFEGPGDGTLVILGHGAGAGMDSSFMRYAAEALAARGHLVCTFNFLYTEAGKRAPDRQAVLEETFEAVLRAASGKGNGKVVLGGKSMGGRIASHVATGSAVDGLVFFGYPLHPPGKPERIRDAHFKDISCPMLFIEGTRDPFCPLGTLERSVTGLRTRVEIAVIEDGDHSFKVRKSSGRSTEDAWTEVVDAADSFLNGL